MYRSTDIFTSRGHQQTLWIMNMYSICNETWSSLLHNPTQPYFKILAYKKKCKELVQSSLASSTWPLFFALALFSISCPNMSTSDIKRQVFASENANRWGAVQTEINI